MWGCHWGGGCRLPNAAQWKVCILHYGMHYAGLSIMDGSRLLDRMIVAGVLGPFLMLCAAAQAGCAGSLCCLWRRQTMVLI